MTKWGYGLLSILLTGCGVARQVEEAKSFARCEFRFVKVERVIVGDVDVTRVKSLKDLSFKKMTKLVEAASEAQLPLDMTVAIEASNPNPKEAALNALEWIALVDGQEIGRGALETRVEVPAQGVTIFPVHVTADLKARGGSAEALLNLAFNLSGEGRKASDILFKIKPTIEIAGVSIPYPGYIEIHREVTAKEGKGLREKVHH